MKAIMLRLVTLVFALGLIGWGLSQVVTHSRSAAELRAESAEQTTGYRPTCDGRTMSPGDTCLAFGDGSKGGSYDELVERNRRANSPKELGRNDRDGRIIGYIALGIGVLVSLGWALAIVAAVRTRRIREVARAHGWSYQREDTQLLNPVRFAGIETDSFTSSHVVSGTHAGLPFLLFDYSGKRGLATAVVVRVPPALPKLVVTSTHRDRPSAESAAEGVGLYTPEVREYVEGRQLPTFAAADTAVVASYSSGGVRPKDITRMVDDVTGLAGLLVVARDLNHIDDPA